MYDRDATSSGSNVVVVGFFGDKYFMTWDVEHARVGVFSKFVGS